MKTYDRITKRFYLNKPKSWEEREDQVESMGEFLREYSDYRVVFMEKVVEDINTPSDNYYAIVVLEKELE